MKQYVRIATDVSEQFPATTNNKQKLVAMDYFSKWPEAVEIPNQESLTMARILIDNLVCRFGVPLELHFESRVFEQLCRLPGVIKNRKTRLKPQSDGMVERFNRIKQFLSKVVE